MLFCFAALTNGDYLSCVFFHACSAELAIEQCKGHAAQVVKELVFNVSAAKAKSPTVERKEEKKEEKRS
jgi:VIT1/CCC1 family predicted Fe2+/Mn2+ transporter